MKPDPIPMPPYDYGGGQGRDQRQWATTEPDVPYVEGVRPIWETLAELGAAAPPGAWSKQRPTSNDLDGWAVVGVAILAFSAIIVLLIGVYVWQRWPDLWA